MNAPGPWDVFKPENLLIRALRDHSGWFMAEGIVLCILGMGAIVLPYLAGIMVTVFLGWLLVMAGVVGLISSSRTRAAPGFWWALISALWAIMVGGYLVSRPVQGLVTLTWVLTAFFIIDGLLMIFLALAHRAELSGRWEWLLINGVIDLVLAAIVLSGLPGTLTWALGLLVGVDMIFGGSSLIMMAVEARKRI